ncbi:MAG: hypothetical protein ACRESK_02280, partial [Gammaproteobacteria bacterium]
MSLFNGAGVIKNKSLRHLFICLLVPVSAISDAGPAVSKQRNATMAETRDISVRGSTPVGAVPPLDYQINVAQGIVLCTTVIEGAAVSYEVREVWKDTDSRFKAGATLRLDTGMHELLGYQPTAGQEVLLFFTAAGLPPHQPLEVLPVVNGSITYSPHDISVQEQLTLERFKERVTGAGTVIPLKVSFTGLKSVRWLALGHNNLAPVLELYADHLVQKVIFRKTRKYSEINSVNVSLTDVLN